MRRGMALMGVLVLLLLLRGPALMSTVLSSAGMLMLRNGLMAQADFVPSTYPVYHVLDETSATARTMRSLRYAVALNGDSPSAQWALGRAALAVGDVETAVSVLEPLMGKVGRNPLLYHDALFTLSYGRRPERVIALYESVPPLQRTRAISDAVVLAYLDLATGRQGDKGTGGQGDKEWEEEGKARQWLERAQRMRPGDLYVNYYLWRRAREGGDIEAAAMYSETLAYFPLEAINPADDRLLDYVADAVPGLLEERLWDREKTLNVVSFLVWRHHGAAGVERLLGRLIERYPTEPEWPFYLAELYHRRGDLDQAETVYREVLAVDPEYAQAYLRLGMVSEAASQRVSELANQRLKEAEGCYEQYREMAPDDLLGLKKLTAVCEALGWPEAAALRGELEAKTDERRIVAELLGVSVEGVKFGQNLIENGGFETWAEGKPEWWCLSAMSNRDPFGAAVFVHGYDMFYAFEGQQSGRVDGFWTQLQEGKSAPRAGYWHCNRIGSALRDIPLEAETPYLLTFGYRSMRVPDGKVTIWVSSREDLKVFWSGGDYGLPRTDGAWYYFAVIGWNCADVEAAIRPLFRTFAAGSVEFDDIQVRSIQLHKGAATSPREAQPLIVRGSD